jgi:hypothetical protein
MSLKKVVPKEKSFKSLSMIQFSPGGDKIAVAFDKPQTIQILKFWECETIASLNFKGHSGRIVKMEFVRNGT